MKIYFNVSKWIILKVEKSLILFKKIEMLGSVDYNK